MDKIVVTVSGIIALLGIYWFFFGKKEENGEVSDTWDIRVEGGYHPDTIRIKEGKPATLTFTRTDANSCLEEVVFPDYKIKEYLPLNKPTPITLPPKTKGVAAFHCSMNMFHGKIDII